MKVLFLLNGLTHYFNLITSKINNQPGVEIFYVYPKEKSEAMGDGVFETKEGANFTLIKLEEKKDSKGELYYEDLDKVLNEIRPQIIMVGETHLFSLINNSNTSDILKHLNIKLILKSIPFRLLKYEEAIAAFKIQLKNNDLPNFKSLPTPISSLLKATHVNKLYKKVVVDKKAIHQFKLALNKKRDLYNLVDGHVNYVDAAFDIYGSYGVPKEKIFITYNSPDTDTYFAVKEKIKKEAAVLPPSRYRIIHLSRLVAWKRVDMLVQAVANLISQYPEVELLIVGDGPEKEKLIKMAETLRVSNAIKFLGGIYDAELFGKYIMSSSIYVLAGMGGLSINDAMIFGLPVICSVCDGTEKHLVKESYNGLYFKDGDQKDLEEKIKILFDNPMLAKEMGENSVKVVENEININTVVERYVGAFKSVLEKSQV